MESRFVFSGVPVLASGLCASIPASADDPFFMFGAVVFQTASARFPGKPKILKEKQGPRARCNNRSAGPDTHFKEI